MFSVVMKATAPGLGQSGVFDSRFALLTGGMIRAMSRNHKIHIVVSHVFGEDSIRKHTGSQAPERME